MRKPENERKASLLYNLGWNNTELAFYSHKKGYLLIWDEKYEQKNCLDGEITRERTKEIENRIIN